MAGDIPVLIPAFNPDNRLLGLVEELIQRGVKHIIVVNDGSDKECDPIFDQLETLAPCTVLKHAVNLGKGRALKTGLNHFYLHFPDSPGVITADGDGQHQPSDILKAVRGLEANQDKLILGTRKFSPDIPFRSLFGNVLTRFIFLLLVGRRLSDTQCGLRGVPRFAVPHLLKVTGERYEYEINMLIMTKMKAIDILEQEIDTIYIEDNRSSHFNPLFDSMSIYFQLLRFTFSSILASFLDFIVFSISFKLTGYILVSMLIARFLVSSMLNYIINRRFVFKSKTGVLTSLSRYYLALVIMSLLAWVLIKKVVSMMGMGIIPAKIAVESLLFILSFALQREFVFVSKEKIYR